MHNIHALSHCVSSNMFCSSQHWSIFLHCRIALAGMKMGTLLWEQLYLDLSWFCGRQPVSFGQPRSSGVVMTRQGSSFWGKKKENRGAEQRFDRICSAGWPIEEPGSASSLQGGQQYVEIDLSATGAILQKSLKITDFGTILSNHKAINSKILQNIPNQAPEHLLPLCGSGRGTPPRHLVRTEPVAKVWNNLLCRWATNCWLNLYNFYFRSPLTLSVPFERLARYNHSFCHRCNFTKVTQYYCLQHHCYQVKAIYSKIWSFSC